MPIGEDFIHFPEQDGHVEQSTVGTETKFRFTQAVRDYYRQADTIFSRLVRGLLPATSFRQVTRTTISTAGDVTLTAAQVLGGWILRDGNGGPRTDTLPTAELLAKAIPGGRPNRENPQLRPGHSFEFIVRNTGASTITIAAGTGGTMSGTATVATGRQRAFAVIFDAVRDPEYTVLTRGEETF